MGPIRIRWKAALPAVGIIVGVLTDPDAVGVIAGALPARAAHILLAVSAIAAIFTPAAATNRAPSEKLQKFDDENPENGYYRDKK